MILQRLTPANPVLSSSNALSRFCHLPWLVFLLFMSALQPVHAATTAVGATPGSFRVSESGAAVYTIPLTLPPGTAGMAPKLSLTYNSQAGNGILGMGWSLEGLSGIYRCPASIAQDGFKGGINFDSNDRFCLDGQRLVAVSGNYGADGTEYRTETESYARIISYGTAGNGPAWFKVWTKAGQIAEYGNSDDSRIEAQGRADVRMWGVNKVSDTKGNYWTAAYNEDSGNGEAYISRIDYTGNAAAGLVPYASVQFGYEPRPDISISYETGSVIKTSKRIAKIKTYYGTALVKDYGFTYEQSASSNRSLIKTLTECDTSGLCIHDTEFGFSSSSNNFARTKLIPGDGAAANYVNIIPGDFNGDGRTDLIYQSKNEQWANLYTSDGTGSFIRSRLIPGDGAGAFYVNIIPGDFNGDGRTDLIYQSKNEQWANLYTSDGTGSFIRSRLIPGDGAGAFYVNIIPGDFNGDGRTDLIYQSTTEQWANLYLSNGDGTFTYSKLIPNDGAGANYVNIIHGDFNGDGKTDLVYQSKTAQWANLYLSNGDGTFAYSKLIPNDGAGANYVNIIPGDFDGDGKTDLVYQSKNEQWANLYLSKGNGMFVYSRLNPNDGSGANYVNIMPGDFNGDGKTDLIYQSTTEQWANLYLSNGDATFISSRLIPGDGAAANYVNIIPSDINGDGKTDLIYQSLTLGWANLYLVDASKSDLMAGITEFTKTVNIEYTALTNSSIYKKGNGSKYPYLDFQGAMYVVSKTFTNNGIGGNYEVDYSYSEGKLHQKGGGFLGFGKVTSQDSQTGIITTTTYRQDYPNQGLLQSVEKKTSTGQLLNQVNNTWQNPSLGAGAYHRSDLTETVEQSWDLNGAAMPRNKTNTEYDEFGNATKITVATDDSYTSVPINPYGNIKQTENFYSNDTTNWILGRLILAKVTSTLPTQAKATRTSAFEYEATSGLLIKEIVEPDNPTLKVVTEHTPDVFGNRKLSTVSGIGIDPRSASSQYDNQGRFPISSTNALGHTENRIFDPAFGNLLSMTGPNGLTTSWVYDGFGRKTQENRPDGTRTTHSYAWCSSGCPANAIYSITTTTSGSPDSTAYFDSLNRQIRAEKVGFDGRIVAQDTLYDALGRIASSTQPYYQGENIVSTQYQYDILGRVTQTTAPDSGTTSTKYNGLVTTVTNDLGHDTQQEKNGLGQLVKTTDALSFSMLFAYDPFGNLTKTTDPYGNQVVIDYDLKGRKIAMHDPDMGNWSYQYNVLGELIEQKNAKGQITTLFYDKLGRMTQRKEPGLTSSWTWDSAVMGKGKLAKFKSTNGHSRNYVYDKFGRTRSVKTTIGSASFTISTQYDGFSRVLKTTYPTGFAVSNVYNGNNYLSEVRDAASKKPFWQATSVDAIGHVTEESLGNGLVTQRDFDLAGRTLGIRTQPFTGDAIQDLDLTWDTVGNLINRNDGVIHRNDLFSYDELNRLTSASGSDGKLLSLAYDAIGNITYKSDVGDYRYGARPHAVTKITGTLNSGFVYDADGNQTKGLDSRTISYTAWDMPAKMTQGSTTLVYAYDANHERFRQTSPSRTTVYINPRIDQGAHFEQTTTPIGTTTLKESRHYIYAGSQVIGEHVIYDSGAKETRYFHSDHLGSINVVTDDKGTVLARYGYEPFGKQTVIQGDANTINHGFTGHEQLAEVGLIHMNGRVYDPITARFLSADPTLQFPDNLQNYNRYSYVMNNPLAFTDPSGYGLGGFLKKLWRNDVVRSVVSIAAAAVTGQVWAPFGSSAFGLFANSVAAGFVSGAVQTGNLNGAVHGAFTAGLFYGAEGVNQGVDSWIGKASAKALTQCISDEASGGNCGRNAVLAGTSEAFSAWHTTDWGVTNPDVLTQKVLDNRVVNFDQITLKVTSEAMVRGVVNSAFGKNFRAGFLSGLPGSFSKEIYGAYVPWDAKFFGPGGSGESLFLTKDFPCSCVEIVKNTATN